MTSLRRRKVVTFDPAVINQFADQLYAHADQLTAQAENLVAQAKMLVIQTALTYGLLGAGAGAAAQIGWILATQHPKSGSPDIPLPIIPALIGAVILGVVGASNGKAKGVALLLEAKKLKAEAFRIKLEAQQVLVMVQIEANTRPVKSPKGAGRGGGLASALDRRDPTLARSDFSKVSRSRDRRGLIGGVGWVNGHGGRRCRLGVRDTIRSRTPSRSPSKRSATRSPECSTRRPTTCSPTGTR